MLAKALPTFVGLALLSGCAGDGGQPRLASDHPANPDAAVAPLPPPSETLAVAANMPPAAAPEGAQDHSAMQHGREHGEHGGTAQRGTDATGHAQHGKPAQPTTSPSTASHPTGASAVYVCPHHPEVTSDKPDERCPKCEMKLVKRATKPDTATGHEGH